jgi:hypothetical protein
LTVKECLPEDRTPNRDRITYSQIHKCANLQFDQEITWPSSWSPHDLWTFDRQHSNKFSRFQIFIPLPNVAFLLITFDLQIRLCKQWFRNIFGLYSTLQLNTIIYSWIPKYTPRFARHSTIFTHYH